MTNAPLIVVSGAVEGIVDEAVLRSLVRHVGALPGPIYGRQGKKHLRQRLTGYNRAARFSPWVVLVDLDQEAECVPPFRAEWLPNPAPHMCFRVAVREIEAWLLADRERLSKFLGIAVSRVPSQPEAEVDPKRTIVELAKQSRRREIREDMVPRPGSGRAVGRAYSSRLIEFISHPTTGWRPDVATQRSESLQRCLIRLQELTTG